MEAGVDAGESWGAGSFIPGCPAHWSRGNIYTAHACEYEQYQTPDNTLVQPVILMFSDTSSALLLLHV